jgi:hypothetical protein
MVLTSLDFKRDRVRRNGSLVEVVKSGSTSSAAGIERTLWCWDIWLTARHLQRRGIPGELEADNLLNAS